MVLHRATTISHSAAESRFRYDAQAIQHLDADFQPRIISPNPNDSHTQPPRKPSLTISPNYAEGAQHQTTIHHPTDPTQPLLPTTRFHTQLESTSLSAVDQAADIEHPDYHRMTLKPSSGTYIGLLCIAIVWLVPLGIIASGGTGGDVVTKALFGLGLLTVQEFPIQDSSPLQPLIWDNVKRGEHCLRYRTREYTAKSLGGRGQVGVEECERSAAEIHEIELRPTFCEDLGWGGVWGHWVVDFGEPDCETRWVDFTDEGCQSETGRRRFTATLDKFNPNDNWLIMCSTTPSNYSFDGQQLPVPTNCQRAKDVVIGIWEVPDRSCQAASIPLF